MGDVTFLLAETLTAVQMGERVGGERPGQGAY
jgi:hypothetical protein